MNEQIAQKNGNNKYIIEILFKQSLIFRVKTTVLA